MNKLKHFFMLIFSTLLIAFGTYFFKFTNNFTFGGITGLAVLIAKTGLISAGDFNFIASMILLIIGMFILGKKIRRNYRLLQHPSLRFALGAGTALSYALSFYR